MEIFSRQPPSIIYSFRKRGCVEELLDCTDDAKEMYIKAVNAEVNMEIQDMSVDCSSASGVQLSLMALFACLLLLLS